MHVHALLRDEAELSLPLLLANGVTGVRDMGCPPQDLFLLAEWRRKLDEGTLPGPRVVAAGSYLDGSGVSRSMGLSVGDPGAARAAVRWLRSAGADFIKVHAGLSREAYFAIADEARQLGMPL